MAPQREWFEKDYYKVLGVSETADAKEITKAYRKLARDLHPDANPGDAAAEERFKEVAAAYDVVGDEARRAEARRGELSERLTQLEADAGRERALLVESDETLKGYSEERARLEAEAAGEQQASEEARGAAETAQAAVAGAEAEMREAADAETQIRARRAQATRSSAEAAARVTRLHQQIAEVAQESETIARTLVADDNVTARRVALEAAQTAAGEAEAAAIAAENETLAAQAALDAARPALQEIEAALNRQEAEAQTLLMDQAFTVQVAFLSGDRTGFPEAAPVTIRQILTSRPLSVLVERYELIGPP